MKPVSSIDCEMALSRCPPLIFQFNTNKHPSSLPHFPGIRNVQLQPIAQTQYFVYFGAFFFFFCPILKIEVSIKPGYVYHASFHLGAIH